MAGWTWRTSRSRAIWRGRGDVHLVAHSVSPELAALPQRARARRPTPVRRPSVRRADPARRRRDACNAAWRRQRTFALWPTAATRIWVISTGFTTCTRLSSRWPLGLSNRLKVAWKHRRYVAEERQALARARLVICNSNRTADDVVRLAGVARDRTRVVYYGIEPAVFGAVDAAERDAARRTLGRSDGAAGWRSLSARSAIGARASTRCSARGKRSVAAGTGTSIWLSPAPAPSSMRGRRAPRASCPRAACASWDSGATCRRCSRPAIVLIHPAGTKPTVSASTRRSAAVCRRS